MITPLRLSGMARRVFSFFLLYIHLYSPYNMVAQANNTGTSKNTTNEKKVMTVRLYTHKIKHYIHNIHFKYLTIWHNNFARLLGLQLLLELMLSIWTKQCVLSLISHLRVHWLPVRQRVAFKLAVLVYKALNNRAPEYCRRTASL